MYEPKNEAHEFVDQDREAAIAKACQFFEMDADELTICGFEEGKVYGLATRALIVATPKNRSSSSPSSGRGSGRRDDADSDSRRDAGRGRDRERGRGRDRGRESAEARGDRPPRERSRRDRSEGNRDVDPAPEPLRPSAGPSTGTINGEPGEVGAFLLGALERMDLGPFEIVQSQDGELVVFELKGPATEALARGEGRAIDALQLLANQVAMRASPERQRVVVDIEGNAAARDDFLIKLAERIAKRAEQSGRAVALDPMNGRDRRSIHIALAERSGVATVSEGEGRYRQVVVVPEGAPGYEDARRESEASNS